MSSTTSQAATLFKVMQILTEEIDRDLPITSALVFVRVAKAGSEGIDQGQVQDDLKLSSSTMSRTAQTLGETHYGKDKPGLGLVVRTMDVRDNHKRIMQLTPKGERLMVKVNAALR